MDEEDDGLPVPLADWLLACDVDEEAPEPLMHPEAHKRVMRCLRQLAALCEQAPDDPAVAALRAEPVAVAAFPDGEAFARWERACHAAATRLL